MNSMAGHEFVTIIESDIARIAMPRTAHFSLGTSPYPAHENGLAIDIYQELKLGNYEVLSPVEGEVLEIREMLAPKPKFNEGIDMEYLTLISNPDNPEVAYKILHVKQCVKKGDIIKIGDLLGTTIRNGYFAPWSSPHLHLEIRKKNDAIRASGGMPFALRFQNEQSKPQIKSQDSSSSTIPIKVHESYPEFLLASIPEHHYQHFKPYHGVKASINDIDCIMDGGIPLYKNGVIISNGEVSHFLKGSVVLWNTPLGQVREIRGSMGLFKFTPVKFLLNQQEVRGMSLFMAPFQPLLKIIPLIQDQFNFERNSTQTLSILPKSPNHTKKSRETIIKEKK